jgi:predicted DNA-binding protein (UPF0251 family)
MPRPVQSRKISRFPGKNLYKPAGIPGCELQIISLGLDEFEALRLADYQQMYQEEAAEKMGVSRQTFGRIVTTARKKVAQALTEGMGLKIEGGNVEFEEETKTIHCPKCRRKFSRASGGEKRANCPKCSKKSSSESE